MDNKLCYKHEFDYLCFHLQFKPSTHLVDYFWYSTVKLDALHLVNNNNKLFNIFQVYFFYLNKHMDSDG